MSDDQDQTNDAQPSDGDGMNEIEGLGSVPEEAGDLIKTPGRPARRGIASKARREDSLEQANRSLAEALKVTFRLIQIAMVVLAGLYVLSGFQSIGTDERGVRVVFGKATARDLSPGFQFSWPYPLGEMVKVNTGTQRARIFRDFWPFITPGREDQVPVDQLRRSRTLVPGDDGSLITADGNIVHARWVIDYSRTDAFEFASSVHPSDSERMVIAAAKRGAVRAVAEVTIDDILKQSSSQDASVARRAQRIAQETLDSIHSGIRIETLSLDNKMPPVHVRAKFAGVQTAASNASKAVEDARRQANEKLNYVAGQASPILTSLIDEYEIEIESKLDDDAASTLTKIFEVMEGRGAKPIAGQVAEELSMARQERSEIVSRARSDAQVFAAKLEQYRSNPIVMVKQDWKEALQEFMGQSNVRVFMAPTAGEIRVLLNSDPEVDKAQVKEMRRLKAIEADRQRRLDQEIQRHRSNTGIELSR